MIIMGREPGGDDDDWGWEMEADAAKFAEYQKDFARDLPDAIKGHESARGHKTGDPLKLERLERDRLLAEAAERIDPANTMLRKVLAHELKMIDPKNFSSSNTEKLLGRARPKRKSK